MRHALARKHAQSSVAQLGIRSCSVWCPPVCVGVFFFGGEGGCCFSVQLGVCPFCVVVHIVLSPSLLHGGTRRKGKGRERITTWLYIVQAAGQGRLAWRRTGNPQRVTLAARCASGPQLTAARRRMGLCPKQQGTKAGPGHHTLEEPAWDRLAGLGSPFLSSCLGEPLQSRSRDHPPSICWHE